jgi:hypothetical protein
MVFHLAQINVARFRAPIADPVNADFVAALEAVNATAESQPGFVWRLVGDGGDATDVRAFDDPDMLVNLSVWTDPDALRAFVYDNLDHRRVMLRRREWFDRIETHMALWWVPAGATPTAAEGRARLEHLAAHGPSGDAFGFSTLHPAPEPAPASPEPARS